MKRGVSGCIVLLLAALLAACGDWRPEGDGSALAAATLDPPAPAASASVASSEIVTGAVGLEGRLGAHIDSLAHAGGSGSRVVFTPGNDWAAAYMARRMRGATADVRYDTFMVRRRSTGKNHPLVNVVARIPGRTDSLLILCAHLDASASRDAGWRRDWRTMPAPGADDNATGLAALLEILALAAHSPTQPRYTIVAIAAQAEERNPDYAGHHLGSGHAAERLLGEGHPVKGVIALDMIGGNRRELYMPVFGTRRAEPMARALRELNEYLRSSLELAPRSTPCDKSDNESFDRFGFPALLLMESCAPWKQSGRSPRYTAYHSRRDLPEMVNLKLVAACTRLVAAYAIR